MRRPLSHSPAGRLGAAMVVAAPLLAAVALATGAGTPAQAASSDSYQVTFVARECPTYTDITANLARNNIQESLQDLGADTAYQSGQPISPSVETPHQPHCSPLVGWKFTDGNGIAGSTDGLSTVSSPGTPVTTQASVPLLDPQGDPTGSSIAGATTVTLTPAQVEAAAAHRLWEQGGTPTDPLVTSSFGTKYAFGALRCAIDNLNGDNVEWVGFPTGTTHVFCYYYAVDQTPTPGTVVVRKQLGPGEVGTDVFHFTGDISYNPGGAFEIPVGGPAPSSGSISFLRDAGKDWSFTEQPTAGFGLTSVSCHSDLGTSTSTVSGAAVTVDLGTGDTMTCTYVDSRNTTDLTLYKQTTGGVGGPFDFTVKDPVGHVTDLHASTTGEDTPVAAGTVADTALGTYTLTESLPAPAADGHWSVAAFDCNGTPGPVATTQTVHVTTAAEPFECTFTNTFVTDASLTITKTTLGGVGTTTFVVTPVPPPPASDPDPGAPAPGDTSDPVLGATTTVAGTAVTATQTSGNPLNPLVPGRYSVVEEGPDDSPSGTWAPTSIACNGAATEPTAAATIVDVTAVDPHVTCAFTNTFTSAVPATTTTSTSVVPATTTPVPGGQAASSTTPGGPGLAATGDDVQVPLGVALALALCGLTLMAVDRARRNRRPAPASVDDPPAG